MERLSREAAREAPLFETNDYRVDLVVIALPEGQVVHPSMLRKYAVSHKTHGVIAGLGEQYAGIIEVARQLQDALDDATDGKRPGDKIPGSMPIPRPPRGGHSGGPSGLNG